MANQHHTRGPHENPPEQSGDREGIKDVLSGPKKDVDVKKHPVDVARGAEKEEQRLLEQMDGEAEGVLKENREKHIAFAEEVRDEVVEPHMRTEEVAQQSALALREQAETKGMTLKELAFETLRKVHYLQA